MRRIPSGDWTAVRSVAAGRASNCPPARVAEDCAAEIVVGTVAGEAPPAARAVASIRMTGATSVAAGATTRGTAVVMDGEVAEDADVKGNLKRERTEKALENAAVCTRTYVR